MEIWEIEKEVKKYKEKSKITFDDMKDLFIQFEQDKKNNVPYEQSDSRTILILINEPLIWYVLNKQSNIRDKEEFYSVAKIALVKAIDNFDLKKGYKFTTFCAACIKNELKMYFRQVNNAYRLLNENIYLEDEIDTRDGKLRYCDVLKDDYDFREDIINDIINHEYTYIVKKVLGYLKPIGQFCIIMYYGLFGYKRKKTTEIAEVLNLTRSNISMTLSNAKREFKLLLSDYNSLNSEDKHIYDVCINRKFAIIDVNEFLKSRKIDINESELKNL